MTSVNQGSASLSVTLVDPKQRSMTQAVLSNTIRAQMSAIPGLRVSIQDLSQQGFTGQKGYPIEFSVRGSDWDVLVAQATKLRDELTKRRHPPSPSTMDYQIGSPELQIYPDRARASDLGIPVATIANTVSSLIGGIDIGQYSTAGRRIDVRMRVLAAQRQTAEDIGKLNVATVNGVMVPISAVTTQAEVPVLQAIQPCDRERAITIYGNVATGHSQAESLAFIQGLQKEMPIGYRVVLSGQSSSFQDSLNSLFFALGLGILVAYMVLASQFNSFLHPVTVLTILPLSVAGAAYGLLAMHKTLNVFSMIGVLLLMGIVKKNSIILVDYATQIREERHMTAMASMLEAGPVRPASDLDDVTRDDDGRRSCSARPRPGIRNARTDGRRGSRRSDFVDGPQLARRAVVLTSCSIAFARASSRRRTRRSRPCRSPSSNASASENALE